MEFIILRVGTTGRLADVAFIKAGITPGRRSRDVALIISGINSLGRGAEVASINAGMTPGTRGALVCLIIFSIREADPFDRSRFDSVSALTYNCSGRDDIYTVVAPAPAPPVTVTFP